MKLSLCSSARLWRSRASRARQPGATQVEQRRLEGIREHRGQAAKEMAGILGIPQRAGAWPSRAFKCRSGSRYLYVG